MSYAAFKMMHYATGIENCASGYITHLPSDFAARIPSAVADDLDADLPVSRIAGPFPNLVVTAGNVLEVYVVRVQEDEGRLARAGADARRGGVMDGIAGAGLELVCHYRLHGNVDSMSILSPGTDNRSKERDSIVLAFQDAKISVLEYNDEIHGLCTSSMHCFEGPEWNYLKRGKESYARGPVVKSDPQGRCGGALIYDLQMVILKAAQVGHGLGGEEEVSASGWPFSVSFESSYIINLRELDIKHIKDFTFVHGYIEPVMVILHEKELTWAGRLSWKRHTCMLSALSINTTLKQHPIIWSAVSLPHDAYQLLPVPAPIGGVLVICANSIIYHSQSSSCALGLNSFNVPAENSSDMPRTNFSVELDAARATWLSRDVAILSAKNGELLLLTLIYDGRVVQRLDLAKSKASVLASGIATIGDAFFFLGSHLGDSILVQYTSGTSSSSVNGMDEAVDIDMDTLPAKRLRRVPSDGLQDSEDISFYSSAPRSSEGSQKNFSFAVRDSLVNVGPFKDFTQSLRLNADRNATGIAKQSNFELVSCGGHGKNGSLCVLQRSIRPELITEVELPGCKGIWTVYHKSSRGQVLADDNEYHAYLIISLESRTMVLETGEMLGEVTESVDYYVLGSTIAAGNMFGRRRVIQVFAHGVRILDGSYMTQELNFAGQKSGSTANLEVTVVSASIADPYVLLTMSDGTIELLIGDPANCTVSIQSPSRFPVSQDSICACSLYHDKGPDPWLRKASTDAWLSTGVSEALDSADGSHYQDDTYCLVCYESGAVVLFDVPYFNCVFSEINFLSGKSHLMDTSIDKSSNKLKIEGGEDNGNPMRRELLESMRVVEIVMHRWSGQYSRPMLLGRLNDGTILCYHAYVYEGQDGSPKEDTSLSSSRLRNLRFVRVSLDSFTREEPGSSFGSQRINIFKNVGGYEGLFLSGARPLWFMLCRERLRLHPQRCDGSVVAFSPLHIVNCNHGLIYVTSQGLLKICQLPSVLNYDNYWPVQKVMRPLSQVLSSVMDQETAHPLEHEPLGVDEMAKGYTIDEFEVRVLEPDKSGVHWETKATISMQPSENALTARMVTLLNCTTKETEVLLAIGTAYVQGEDVAGRGRILLFSLGKDMDNPQNLVVEVFSKEIKGAISSLASLQGHLLVASGPKVTLYKWTGTELNGVAFFDAPPLHAVSMNIVKNFILLGDIHKSVYFLSWKEQGAQLNLLAKDFGSLNCCATEFLIDGSTLSLVVSDDQKNIQIFYYAPKMLESWKGQKLLSRAEFHTGLHITKFLRLQMLPTVLDQSNPGPGSDKTNRFALLFGTLDGSIGCISPLEELTFRRLQTLQKKLVDSVSHACGLNPRSFRQFKSNGRAHRPGPDNVVDCELLSHYEMLPLEEQLEIAQQIGTTRAQILNNLNDLHIGTSFL
ncbi:cleavage and polyadenylation specificity factor 160 isoform X2 [Wolffia australiana]